MRNNNLPLSLVRTESKGMRDDFTRLASAKWNWAGFPLGKAGAEAGAKKMTGIAQNGKIGWVIVETILTANSPQLGKLPLTSCIGSTQSLTKSPTAVSATTMMEASLHILPVRSDTFPPNKERFLKWATRYLRLNDNKALCWSQPWSEWIHTYNCSKAKIESKSRQT